ncbi:MAG: hypothetical protein II399_00335 [Lachnospiraceae bacterium]|nr:hypothetical protein [Lachnospiraceae bacterium]
MKFDYVVFRLMHKNVLICDFSICFCDCIPFVSPGNIYNAELLPFPLKLKFQDKLQEWLLSRCFSNYRFNNPLYLEVLSGFPKGYFNRIFNSQLLVALLCYGASLSDSYWINPETEVSINTNTDNLSLIDGMKLSPQKYEDINFWSNNIVSPEIQRISMSSFPEITNVQNYHSPDICTSGRRLKAWQYNGGKFVLRKKVRNSSEYLSFFESARCLKNCIIPKITCDGNNIVFSECITNQNLELLSVRDLIWANDLFTIPLEESLRMSFEKFDMDNMWCESLLQIIKSWCVSDESLDLTNFGFLLDGDTGKIVNLAVWSLPFDTNRD